MESCHRPLRLARLPLVFQVQNEVMMRENLTYGCAKVERANARQEPPFHRASAAISPSPPVQVFATPVDGAQFVSSPPVQVSATPFAEKSVQP